MYLVLWQLTFAGAPFRGQNRISKVVSGLAGSPCTFDTIDYPYSNLCFESAIYFVGIFTLTLPMISVDCNWSETLARKAYGYGNSRFPCLATSQLPMIFWSTSPHRLSSHSFQKDQYSARLSHQKYFVLWGGLRHHTRKYFLHLLAIISYICIQL